MHANISSTFYLALIPAAIFFLIAILLRRRVREKEHYRYRLAKGFFNAGLAFIILLAVFLTGHFVSLKGEMKKRAGIYRVLYWDRIEGSCSGISFDSLQLTLKKNGKFTFNYKPCFSNTTGGKWVWTDNLVHSYSVFDKINDSLELRFPSETDVNIIELTNYGKAHLTFERAR
jgi:hypothetical protein